MNKLLWIAQALIALFFGAVGLMKVFSPASFAPLPINLVLFIGVAEFLGALGLILPGLTGIKPQLTAWAAGGLATVMILATGYNLAHGDFGPAVFTIILLAINAFIARGRFGWLVTGLVLPKLHHERGH